MENIIEEKIERTKLKARMFLKKNQRAFIKDINKNYYFCDIKGIDEECIKIVCFTGSRQGEIQKLLWIDIIFFDEYREQGRKNV